MRQRGRPRKKYLHKKKADNGAEFELHDQQKSWQRLTLEPLDLCLTKNIITKTQHECCAHFRWLHVLLFGLPRFAEHDLTSTPGKNPPRYIDESWLETKAQEYRYALAVLNARDRRLADTILDISLYRKCPPALTHSAIDNRLADSVSLHSYIESSDRLALLQQGCEILCTLYCPIKRAFRYA